MLHVSGALGPSTREVPGPSPGATPDRAQRPHGRRGAHARAAVGPARPEGGRVSTLQTSGLRFPVLVTPTSPGTRVCSQVGTPRGREAQHPVLGSQGVCAFSGEREGGSPSVDHYPRLGRDPPCTHISVTFSRPKGSVSRRWRRGTRRLQGLGGAAIHSRSDPGKLPLHPGLSFPKRGVRISSYSWTFRPLQVSSGISTVGERSAGRRPRWVSEELIQGERCSGGREGAGEHP